MADTKQPGRDALQSINLALAEGISSPGVFQAIIHEAVRLCHAERGFLLLDAENVVAAIGADRGDYSREVVKSVQQSKVPHLADGTAGDIPTDAGHARRSAMAAPLVSEGRVVGLIYLDALKKMREFDEIDLALLGTLTEQAVLAFKLALFKRELDLQREEADHQVIPETLDGLTGLANRRALDRHLASLLEQTASFPISLILLDIDDFKHYNDHNGVAAGDELLRRLGMLLGSSLRDPDLAARYGGEEFAVVLPYTTLENALVVAERLRLAIARTTFPFASSQPGGNLTISLGAACALTPGLTTDAFFRATERALTTAKAQGKNRVIPAD